MNKQAWIKIFLVISRVVLGLVFVFSGFVKGVDPMGSAYKFTDYFTAFGMGFLEFLAVPLAFILSAVEFLIGISLLMRLKFRLGAWAVLVFMTSFTVLTFIFLIYPNLESLLVYGIDLQIRKFDDKFRSV